MADIYVFTDDEVTFSKGTDGGGGEGPASLSSTTSKDPIDREDSSLTLSIACRESQIIHQAIEELMARPEEEEEEEEEEEDSQNQDDHAAISEVPQSHLSFRETIKLVVCETPGGGDDEDDDEEDLTPLNPFEKVLRYSQSTDFFDRQVLCRTLHEALRFVLDTPEFINSVLEIMVNVSNLNEPTLRTELMEQVPQIAFLCHDFAEKIGYLVTNTLVPMVVRYLTDPNEQVRKTSQAALLVLLEQQLISHTDVHDQVCPVILDLTESNAQDEFKTEAVALMSKMAPLVGIEMTERLFVERFTTLCSDNLFQVRKVCAANFGEFSGVIGMDGTENVLLPLFVVLCEDGVWGIRKACADVFMAVSCACSLETRRRHLSPIFISLLTDQSRWVRVAAYQNLGPFISTFADPNLTGLDYKHGFLVVENPSIQPVLNTTHLQHDSCSQEYSSNNDKKLENTVPAISSSSNNSSIHLSESDEEHFNLDNHFDEESHPDIRSTANSKLNEDPTFNELNYWKIPLPHMSYILEDPETIFEESQTCFGSLIPEVNDSEVSQDIERVPCETRLQECAKESSTIQEVAHEDFSASESADSQNNIDEFGTEWEAMKQALVVRLNETQPTQHELQVAGEIVSEILLHHKDNGKYDSDDGKSKKVEHESSGNVDSTSPSSFEYAIEENQPSDPLFEHEDTRKICQQSAKEVTPSQEVVEPHSEVLLHQKDYNYDDKSKEEEEEQEQESSGKANLTSLSPFGYAVEENQPSNSIYVHEDKRQPKSYAQVCAQPPKDTTTQNDIIENKDGRGHEFEPDHDDDDVLINSLTSTSPKQSSCLWTMGSSTREFDDHPLSWLFLESAPNLRKSFLLIDTNIVNEINQDIVPKILLEHYISMTDPARAENVENEITRYCAYSLPAVALTLGRRYWPMLKDTYYTLSTHMHWKVRRTLAFSIHELALILGEALTTTDLLPVFEDLSKDLDEVRIGMVKHLSDFLKILPEENRRSFLPRLKTFLRADNALNWRFRLELTLQLGPLSKLFTAEECWEFVWPVTLLVMVNEKIVYIRKTCYNVVSQLARHMLLENDNDTYVVLLSKNLHESFGLADTWTKRQSYVYSVGQIIRDHSLPVTLWSSLFLSKFLELSSDKVANIRAAVAKIITCYILDYLHLMDCQDASLIEETLGKLREDPDRDVRYFASNQFTSTEYTELQDSSLY